MVPVGYEIDVMDPKNMFKDTNELKENELKKYLIIGD